MSTLGLSKMKAALPRWEPPYSQTSHTYRPGPKNVDLNKGTHTPKGPAHLQGLDASTQLHGELLLSTPELLEVNQPLGQILVLLEDFLHPRRLCHIGRLHLPPFSTLSSHLKEGLVNVKPIKMFDALTSFSRTSIRLSNRLPIEDACLISKLVGTPLPLVDIPGSLLESKS